MQGSNVETIAGTNIIVGGTFSINGDDLTNELYDGVLTSQATREDPAKAQEAITQALNAGIQNYLESANTQEESTPPYSGYSSTAISTIQTTAVSEHWDESTTSLNALGQLVVQAVVAVATAGAGNTILAGTTAAGNTIVTAAVQSVVNQVSTELLTAVITGEGVNLDLGNLVTGAVKAAVFAGVTDAIDTELFADTEGNILPREELSFTQNVSKEVLHASASTAIYGGDFKDNVIAAVGDAVAAPAFEYVGHTLTNTDGLNLDPNDLSTQALITTSHALVGGTIAELSGGEFSSGAVATAVGHVVGEYIGGALFEDYYSGTISKEEFRTTATAIAQAVGGATVLLTQENVSQEELNRAASMAESVVVNNSIAMYEALAAGLAGAGIAVGTVPALIAALGAGAVYVLVNNGDGDIRQGIANAYNALPGNDNVAMVTSNGLEILDNTPEPTIGGGIQTSMDDIKTSTGIPEYNEDGNPTIGGGITGELERPEVGGFSTETQERPTVGGVDGELRGGVVYTAEDKPEYKANPAHDIHSPLYNPNKTPEPIDSKAAYEKSIKDSKGNYYGVNDKGEIYQYANSGDGTYHYAGTITKQQLYRKSAEGNKIRKQLGLRP